ncbi:MAG TPA: hypothetical protein VFE78_20095 [Gemmataceae bacterium]|jgi:ElaB/YqjD/DUF883 family membrane-anchored ribosome-binding protein|nr:hypothetical protein [Gemmataceae bacterium]
MAGPTNHGPSFTEQPRQPTAGTPQQNRPDESGMLGSAASTIKEKAKDLASGASDMAGQVKDTARDWASSARSGAQHAWESTRDEARHLASQAAHTAENAWDGLGDVIRRNPVPSLLIALGVGFLLGSGLGAMTSRRSNW